MDASNEAPLGVGLDEFIEFTKGGRGGFFFFFLLTRANSFTQTKGEGGGGDRLRNFGLIFICSLAASERSALASFQDEEAVWKGAQ